MIAMMQCVCVWEKSYFISWQTSGSSWYGMAGVLVIVNMTTYLVGWLNTHLCVWVWVCVGVVVSAHVHVCLHACEYVFSCSNDVYVPFIGTMLNLIMNLSIQWNLC